MNQTSIVHSRRSGFLATLFASFALLLAFQAASIQAATANPPAVMTYQGYLTDATGTPLGNTAPANFSVVFKIFNVSTGGTALWNETQTVTVDKGSFSVLLGTQSTGLDGAFAGADASDRWIEMTVTVNGTPTTVLPRLRLVSSPFSFLAKTAIGLYQNDGSSLLNLNANNLSASSTVPDARLSTNIPKLNAAQTFSGANTFSATISASAVTATGTVTASDFVGNGTVPLGGIIMWSGTQVPSGWALCNGQTSNGRSTPNLQDKFIVGAGSAYAIGGTGGSTSVSLSIANLPAHAHTYRDGMYREVGNTDSNDKGEGQTGYYIVSDGVRTWGSSSTDGDNTATLFQNRATWNTGGNQAFDIRPPYYALAFIMRVQ